MIASFNYYLRKKKKKNWKKKAIKVIKRKLNNSFCRAANLREQRGKRLRALASR